MLICEPQTVMKVGNIGDLTSRLSPSWDRGSALLLMGRGPHPTVFRARKSVLAANSPVFRSQWPHPTADPDCVSVPDVDPEAFTLLLRYWYTGDARVTAISTAFHLLHAAKKYCVDALTDRCRRFLAGAVNTTTACEMLERAREADESSLMASCCSLLRSQTSAVLQQDSFLEASSKLVVELLDEDSLNVSSELELVRAVDRWSEAECRRRGLPSDRSARRSVAAPLLHAVVFLSLSVSQFLAEECLKHLLTAEEYRDILSNIVEPGSCPLPAGFSNRLSRSCRPCVVGRLLTDKDNYLSLCPNCNKFSCCLMSSTYNARRCHLCRVVVL